MYRTVGDVGLEHPNPLACYTPRVPGLLNRHARGLEDDKLGPLRRSRLEVRPDHSACSIAYGACL